MIILKILVYKIYSVEYCFLNSPQVGTDKAGPQVQPDRQAFSRAPASWTCSPGPHSEGPTLGLMLCCHPPEILHNF